MSPTPPPGTPATGNGSGKVIKRNSKACKRCTRRKQRCHGFPVCRACEEARVSCEPSAYAMQLYSQEGGATNGASNAAALHRIQTLETQLAEALSELAVARQQNQNQQNQNQNQNQNQTQTQHQNQTPQQPQRQEPTPQPTPQYSDPNQNPFLLNRDMPLLFTDTDDASTLIGGQGGQAGHSMGHGLGQNPGNMQPTVEQMVQATVWSKGLFSVGDSVQPMPSVPPMTPMSPIPLSFTVPSVHHQAQLQHPPMQHPQMQQPHPSLQPPPPPPPPPPQPSDAMGRRMLDAYFTKIHPRYPFLDRDHLFSLHERAQQHDANSPPLPPSLANRFDVFRLNMVYAIGGTHLKITDPLCEAQAETYLSVALRDVAVVQDAQSLSTLLTIEGLVLLVLYNLRAPTNTGIWYLTNLAMQTCIDLRLHLEAAYHEPTLSPAQTRTMRRLFWSAYVLDRFIALSFKRPYSIAENDIETHIPEEAPDEGCDDGVGPMWRRFIQIKRLESRIQTDVYGLAEPLALRRSKIGPLLRAVDTWGQSNEAPSANLTPSERVYLRLQWNAAVAQLLRPFLSAMSADDPLLARCLHAAGHVCALFREMHMRDAYGHSFVSAHLTFITGVTMCYCLFRAASGTNGQLERLLDHRVAHHLRACSSTMFIIAERYHRLRKHRDILEDIIGRIMDARMSADAQGGGGGDRLAEGGNAANNNLVAREETPSSSRPQFSQLDFVAVQSLLNLAAQQEPDTCTSPAATTVVATPDLHRDNNNTNINMNMHAQPANAMLPPSWPTLDFNATGSWDVDRYSLEMLGRMISA